MTEVLPQTVADIYRRGPRAHLRELASGREPRRGPQKAIDQVFANRAARMQLAIENSPSQGRVAHRPSDINPIPGPGRIAPENSIARLAQQRQSDRQLRGARDIAADDIDVC